MLRALVSGDGRRVRPARRGSPSTVVPLDVIFGADLEYWHKSWEADGLTLSSDLVSSAADFSGNGVTFTQGNPAQRPPVLTVGSLRGINFNDPAAALNIGGAGVALAQPFYYMAVARPVLSPSANQNRHIIYDLGGAAMRWNEADLDFQSYPGTADIAGDGVLDSAQAVIAYINGTSSWIEINGVRSAAGGSGTASLGGVFTCYGTGGGFGSNDGFVGQLFEGALVSGAQTDAALSQATAYLQSIAALAA